MTESREGFIVALEDLVRVLEDEPMGMIIGGMAVIALGYPRTTTDIDATVLVARDNLERFRQRLAEQRIVPRVEKAVEFALSHHILLMRHAPTGIDIDISLAVLPFEEQAIYNRQAVVLEGLHLFVPQVEDLIIYKMVALRPQDLRDIEALLLRYHMSIDLHRIRSVVQEFSAVSEQPEMLIELEKLIKQAQL